MAGGQYFVVTCGGWQIRPVSPLLNSHLNSGFVLVVSIGVAGKLSAVCSDRIIDGVALDFGSWCSLVPT
jgi:hypothetical protein